MIRALRLFLLRGQLRTAQRDAAELEAFHAGYEKHAAALRSRINGLRADLFYLENNHRALRVNSRLAGNSGLARHRKETV